jgi:hypothetical protein
MGLIYLLAGFYFLYARRNTMISVPGTINIRTVHGRFGAFNTATLECSIGTFTVKDSSIEEYDEGSYVGNFVIENIKPHSYITSGRVNVEVRAKLNAIILNKNVEHKNVVLESFEQDPIEEEFVQSTYQGPSHETLSSAEVLELGDDAFAEKLFGILYPLGNVIKLDATINRTVFRQQREYLKDRGYRFVASEQHWVK